MNKVIITEKYPIKLWLDDIEDGALQQARDLANLPFVHKWVSLMADSHQGYGMPIGGVLATNGVVIPNAVGVDIGCGMCAVKTSLKSDEININEIKEIMGSVREDIPVGFNHHKEPQKWEGFANTPHTPFIQNLIESASYQLGTLGGGNHFIELQQDENGFLCVMIHTGSRRFGYDIANYFHAKAVETCGDSSVPKELAYLSRMGPQLDEYLKAQELPCRFAKQNRRAILTDVLASIASILGNFEPEDPVETVHNFSAEAPGHKYICRKGAVRAYCGDTLNIPGSQGTCSCLCEGLGNALSYCSCSHGAGRRMSRTRAKKELNYGDEAKKMDGIIHNMNGVSNLDEAPGAYKDIDAVMAEQATLAKIKTKLTPVAVLKA